MIQVMAFDGGSPPNTDTATLEIFLLDTNDEVPEFVQGNSVNGRSVSTYGPCTVCGEG